MIRIAPVTADQLEELAALYTELEGNVTNRERLREKFALLQDHPDYLLLGAVHESGRLVGSVMGITCQDLTGNCRPFMVLENMIVTEALHRSGIGQMLLGNCSIYPGMPRKPVISRILEPSDCSM
ncbi:GNAT family N-acetyltransferase [Paenibacillus dendritiformis]|uniref:GNAT family N-acetyltransferase n=1 Tax=Paenibacillus dendritiformis TaxID=130049 RepID=UPI00364C64E7